MWKCSISAVVNSVNSKLGLLSLRENMSENLTHVQKLLKRLNRAEKQIEILQTEVREIRSEILTISATKSPTTLFSARRDFSTFQNAHESDLDGPVLKKIKLEFTKEGDYVIVYTDGACSQNGKTGAKAGIGVWWGPNHPLNTSKKCARRNTNNSAEIQACTEACNIAMKNGILKLLIRTDSQFTINCMTKWLENWKRKKWINSAGKKVVNREDVEELERASQLLQSVKYEYVAGHMGIEGNEGADQLAVRGAEM